MTFIFLACPSLSAEEHWKHYFSGLVPFSNPQAIVVFNETLFVSADSSVGFLWKTRDGKNWESDNWSKNSQVHFESLVVYRNRPYGFGVRNNGDGTFQRKVYRGYPTASGAGWELVDWGQFGMGHWSDVVVHDDSIYAAGRDGSIWKIQDDARQPDAFSSEILTPPTFQFTGSTHIDLESFKGFLYTAHVGVDPQVKSNPIYISRTADDTTWETYSNFFTLLHTNYDRPIFNFAKHDDELYWGASFLLKSKGTSISDWEPVDGLNSAIPMVLHDRVHHFSSSSPAMVLNEAGIWEEALRTSPAFCVPDPRQLSNVAHFKDMAFALFCDLWMLKKGVTAVELTTFQTTDLKPQEEGGTVIALKVDLNFEETLRRLTLVNAGSAEAVIDMKTLKLFRTPSQRLSTQSPEPLVELLPEDDGKTWSTPPAFTLSLKDGDTLFVTVDLADLARVGRTIQFYVPQNGLDWTISQTFIMVSNLTAPQSQEIKAAAATSPIADVIIYPQPAKDSVRFTYDLTSASDVQIKIMDRTGVLVSEINNFQSTQNQAQSVWDSSTIAPGTYFATIRIKPTSGGERFFKRKIYIQK